jgi:hypothetical protein
LPRCAGYAAWSQVFNVSSTVSTGELLVQVSDQGITDVAVDGNGDGDYGDEEDVDVTSDNADDYYLVYPTVTTVADASGSATTLSELAYTIEKLYPGTQITSAIEFENIGTIRTNKPSVDVSDSVNIVENPLWNDLVIKVNGTPIAGSDESKLTNLANAIANAIDALEPGSEAKTVTIVQELPITSDNDTENESLTWNVELTFEQYNAPAS